MGATNNYLFKLIFGLSHRNFLIDDIGVFLAEYLPYLLVLGSLIFIFLFEGWKKRILVFSEGLMALILSRGIITEAVRFFYHSPRPFKALNLPALINESSFSFPSGHAALFFALATTIFYLSRRLGIWYFALASVNGIARIFVGVHWPFDILGGAIVGILSAMLIHKLLTSVAMELEKKGHTGL